MMTFFSSLNRALCSTFDTITEVGTATQETVSMGTNYVHNRAVEQNLTDKHMVQLRTAKAMREFKAELDADKDLAKIFNDLSKDFA